MHSVVISGTGLWVAPQVISNDELVVAFNAYSRRFNEENALAIAVGEVDAVPESSVEFIEKASGIKQRYVVDKAGILDPTRMRPRIAPRPDDELSLSAEMAVAAATEALAAASRDAADIDMVLCAASNLQRPYPAMAVEIQGALGAGGYAFDMNVACSSATFALEQAINAVRTGSARAALVVSPARYNAKTGLMVCCPLTTQIKGYPFEVPVTVAGQHSAVLFDQSHFIQQSVDEVRDAAPESLVDARPGPR